MLHAVCDMIAKDVLLKTAQGCAHRPDLGDDVDAVTVLFDHAGNAAHLTLNAIEPFCCCLLDVVSHAVYIPRMGIGFNPPLRTPQWPQITTGKARQNLPARLLRIIMGVITTRIPIVAIPIRRIPTVTGTWRL